MKVEIIAITPDSELVIEKAARKCYDTWDRINPPESTAKIIKHLIDSGHDSCLEHGVVSFNIEGVSRSLTHQLVRHRIASYSQRSQRYVKETEPSCVIPRSIAENPEALDVFEHVMKDVWMAYKILLKTGVKAEDARFLLPNACTTELVATFNYRSLRNFFKLRLDSHAQWEIREMAEQMLELVVKEAPNVFKDIYLCLK